MALMDLRITMLYNLMEFQANSQIPLDFTDKAASFGKQIKFGQKICSDSGKKKNKHYWHV